MGKKPKAKVAVKAKVGVKAKVAVKKPKASLKLKIGAKKPKAKAGLKLKIGAKKPKAKVGAKKPKSKLKLKVKIGGKKTKKVATGPRFTIGAKGWVLNAGQKMTSLDSSFNAYVKAKQAANWAGKVSSDCVNSPMMKKWTAKLILATTQDDIKFSKMFWKGALELNMAIGRGKNSKFAKFLGKKILGIKAAKKLTKKLREKAGLKLKLKGKKTTKKAGLKLKIGAKKPKAKAGLKLKIGAKKPKASLKLKAKVGAKAKVSVKKPKVKASLKVKAKKQRRLQTTTPAASTEPSMNVSSNGVNLADAQFQANVPQPTALAGDGQSSPSKSWMMFAGMMTLVALLFN